MWLDCMVSQPLADGLKLFLKESIIPSGAHKGIFAVSHSNLLLSRYGMSCRSVWRRYGLCRHYWNPVHFCGKFVRSVWRDLFGMIE